MTLTLPNLPKIDIVNNIKILLFSSCIQASPLQGLNIFSLFQHSRYTIYREKKRCVVAVVNLLHNIIVSTKIT